jgi:tRNA(Arg) A34 adenosine deaminase TadA
LSNFAKEANKQMEKEREYMAEAIRIAKENVVSGNGGPFGAVIVKDGEIIARGVNTVTADNDPTAHAEINAIRNAAKQLNSFQLDGCEIYSSCEPCPMCLGAIYWARPAKLYFAATKQDAAAAGFDDSFIYEELSLPAGARKIPTFQTMRLEANEIFVAWDALDNKIEY